MARFGSLGTQYFNASGEPLVNGLIYFYESGTTTPKATYADINQTVANPNPVVLDASGYQPNIFFNGVAKAVLATSANVQIQTRDPVGDTAVNIPFQEWVPNFSYSLNDLVLGSNGEFYISLENGNIGNDPTISPTEWQPFFESIIIGQDVVAPNFVAIGNATTGFSGLDVTAKGSILVGNGTAPIAFPYSGVNGELLSVDTSEPSGFAYVSPPSGPNPITTVTATAAVAALLNSGITSAYSVYDLICVGSTSAADGLNLRVELAGSVISTSTYIYASDGLLSGTGAVAATNAGTGAPVTSVPLASSGAGAARPFYLKITIISPSAGSQSTQLLIDNNIINNSDQVRRQTITAMNTGTTALTGIQLIPVSGTVTCTMNLYPANIA